MEDYFGYDVFMVMNITDIDDKIIIRARRNHLFDVYRGQHNAITAEVIKDLHESWDNYIVKLEKKLAELETERKTLELEAEKKQSKRKDEIKAETQLAEEKLAAAKQARAAVDEPNPPVTIIDDAKDVLSEVLDGRSGKTVDQELMKELSRDHSLKYEQEFLDDMKALGIRTPDVLTRVSEYVPEITEMVQKIIDNGFGYVAKESSEGPKSVYFDTAAFTAAKEHHYGKLEPWSIGNNKLLAEGEGALASGGEEKRNSNDFALWKASKPGEPAWDSPWGRGRPGWHIECSAMAGKILGKTMDVHSGGEDLKFPHHDNELAQSEAYFNNDQWVNYFLHAGHLNIDGLKMSKSLKNFITIRDALGMNGKSGHTARQLRMLFLLQSWDKGMNYQRQNTMEDVQSKETTFFEFFLKVDNILQERKNAKKTEAWNKADVTLHSELMEKQNKVHAALLDNFNTKEAIQQLSYLVNSANSYLTNNPERKGYLLKKVAVYVSKILRVFGVIDSKKEFGFQSEEAGSGMSKDEVARPYVEVFANFRNAVRAAAKENKSAVELLKICDKFRDEDMVQLGVKIADESEFPFSFVPIEQLLREREDKKRNEQERERAKKLKKKELLERELEQMKKWAVSPEEFTLASYQINWAPGQPLPEKDNTGKDLSKNAKKKIETDYNKQKQANDKYLLKLKEDPHVLETMQQTIDELKQELGNN
jgi:cysteinyl-tRNA synthetase